MDIVTNKGKLKVRSSLYNITINTNKSLVSNADNIPALKDMLKSFLLAISKPEKFEKFLIDMGPVGTPRTHYKPATSDIIESITINNTIEANVSGRAFLHSHTIVKVIHKSRVQINIDLLKKIFYRYSKSLLTVGGEYMKPYINVKATTDTEFNMVNYVKAENRDADVVDKF